MNESIRCAVKIDIPFWEEGKALSFEKFCQQSDVSEKHSKFNGKGYFAEKGCICKKKGLPALQMKKKWYIGMVHLQWNLLDYSSFRECPESRAILVFLIRETTRKSVFSLTFLKSKTL